MATIVQAGNVYGEQGEFNNILTSYEYNTTPKSPSNPLGIPADFASRAVRASRMIDRLPFTMDTEAPYSEEKPRTTLYRWPYDPADKNVPDRIAHAVALIAMKLEPDSAGATLPRRPQAVRAGSVAVEYPNSTQDIKPQMSDSEILARRLGIPDPRAVDLLRPWLKLPADLLQDDRPPGTSIDVELYVQGQNIPPRDLRS